MSADLCYAEGDEKILDNETWSYLGHVTIIRDHHPGFTLDRLYHERHDVFIARKSFLQGLDVVVWDLSLDKERQRDREKKKTLNKLRPQNNAGICKLVQPQTHLCGNRRHDSYNKIQRTTQDFMQAERVSGWAMHLYC